MRRSLPRSVVFNLHPPAEGRRTRRAATSVDVRAPEIGAVLSKMCAETSRRASENDGIAARSVSLSALGVYTLLPSTGREQFVRVQTIRFRGLKAGHVKWSSEAPGFAAEPTTPNFCTGDRRPSSVASSPSPMVRFSTSCRNADLRRSPTAVHHTSASLKR